MTKTATCGWCKRRGVDRHPNGDLHAHFIPSSTKQQCVGEASMFRLAAERRMREVAYSAE